jgi:phosphatidylglycerophosphatase A
MIKSPSPLPPSLKFFSLPVLLGTWFGCGLMRPAPGTWGSLGALPFAILILSFGGAIGLTFFAIALFIIGLWASKKILTVSGADQDPQMIVIDEVVGQSIALLPALLNPLLLAFILFRFFDATKIWPVSFFDKKVPGALGVMGDDVVAGIMAALTLWGIQYAGFI